MSRRVVIYILCLLAFVEISSRVFWHMLDRTWGFVVPQQIGRLDPELGWSLKPGAEAWSKATGLKVKYAINSLGYRGPEVSREKPQGTFRIVVLGDSHAFGFGIPEGQRFSNLLQGYFKNLEVVNLAVSGYGLDQMLLRLKRDGFPLKPDLVICYVPHFGDFRHMTDKLWGLGKPRFLDKDGGLSLVNCPVANNQPLYMAAMAADSFLAEWCRTYDILRNTVYYLMVPKTKPGQAPPAIDPKLWAETVDLGWRITLAMRDQCREHGAQLVLATDVGELAMKAYQADLPTAFPAFALTNPELALKHDPFRHPNEAANGIIAWELTKFLKENKLVPQDHWLLPF
jgi:hypothetical protein